VEQQVVRHVVEGLRGELVEVGGLWERAEGG
jgi:hypothetical protein